MKSKKIRDFADTGISVLLHIYLSFFYISWSGEFLVSTAVWRSSLHLF